MKLMLIKHIVMVTDKSSAFVRIISLFILFSLMFFSSNIFGQSFNIYSGTKYVTNGTFYDAGGTGTYYSSESYTMTLYPAVSGAKVRLNFSSFYTESGFDKMTIYDNNAASGTILLNAFSGNAIPTGNPFTATNASGALTIVWSSDGSVEYDGWVATISLIGNLCSGSFYDSGGPSATHSDNESYSYTFYPVVGTDKVRLNFSAFYTEGGWDKLTIYDNTSASGTILLNAYSGNGVPAGNPFTATNASGALTIVFVSDGSATYDGWTAAVSCYNPCTAPSISVQPISQTICAGSSVTLSVTAGGTGLNYQWRKGGTNVGANSSSYTIASPVVGDAGSYDVVITGTCGTVTSSAATLTVNSLSTAPTSASVSVNPVCTGNPTTLTVTGGSLGTGGTWTWGYGVCGPVFNEDIGAAWPTYWRGATTENWAIGSIANLTSTSADPMIGMEAVGSFNPSIYKYIQIRYRVVSGTAGNAEIFYTNDRSAGAVGDQMVSGALISDGAWHSLTIDMSVGTYWNGYGNIRGWRYDWATNAGVTMEIDNISLSVGQGTSVVVNPTANTTYYVRADGVCGSTACVNTTVNVTTTLPAIPYAGEDQYICGATSVTMAASGTGTWSVVSGPNTPNIVSPNATNTQIGTVTGLISGTYVFRWSTSNVCGASYDDVVVIKQ